MDWLAKKPESDLASCAQARLRLHAIVAYHILSFCHAYTIDSRYTSKTSCLGPSDARTYTPIVATVMRFSSTIRPALEVMLAWVKRLRVLGGYMTQVTHSPHNLRGNVILLISQAILLVRSCRLGHLFC
jgi:hypothetical protein